MMRENNARLIFWGVSFVICIIIILIHNNNKNKISYEKKEPVKVFSEEEFKDDVKDLVEDYSFGKKHRAVFTSNKDEAIFCLTDELDAESESKYKKVAWSPLVIAMDTSKKKEYTKAKYLNDEGYVEFYPVINAVISGEFKDKIYYPKLNTKEGKLFEDFLIITINNGKYPNNESLLNEVQAKVEEFYSAEVTIETDALEQLKNKQEPKNEWIFVFENELYEEINNSSYKFYLGYPSNTVLHEWYYYCQNEDLLKIIEKTSVWQRNSKIESIFCDTNYRNNTQREAYNVYYGKFDVKDSFTYVEIPAQH